MPPLATFDEIKTAVEELSREDEEILPAHLAEKLGRTHELLGRPEQKLQAHTASALEGLPQDLSTETKEKMQRLLAAKPRIYSDEELTDMLKEDEMDSSCFRSEN